MIVSWRQWVHHRFSGDESVEGEGKGGKGISDHPAVPSTALSYRFLLFQHPPSRAGCTTFLFPLHNGPASADADSECEDEQVGQDCLSSLAESVTRSQGDKWSEVRDWYLPDFEPTRGAGD